MTNRETEKKLKQAFEKATPNVLDAVLSQCEQQKGNGTKMTVVNSKKSRPVWMRAASLAAALVLVLGLGLGVYGYTGANTVTSVVSLDVNPSLELRLNKNETVISVEALNEDGEIILGDMELKGSDLDVAVNALLGSMLRNGYLSELANSILISVENDDPEKCAQLQAELTEKVNALLSTDSFEGAVLTQTVSKTDELTALAEEYGISLGKAQLIQTIVSQNSRYTFESLVGLTINELNLISVSGGQSLEGVDASGTASDKSYIGTEAATAIALEAAGVAEADLVELKLDLDMEDGVLVYEVDFETAEYKFEYEINATTGEILKSEKDGKQTATTSTTDVQITADAAKTTALTHAGVTADAITQYKSKLEQKHSGMIYEISFYADGYEYEYEIDATTGEILSWEKDLDDDTTSDTVVSSTDSLIGESAAKTTALNHAGVTASSITNYKCELDRDDGLVVYEIEFDCGGYEYDYEINATTGTIISWEKEYDDDQNTTSSSSGTASAALIGESAAKTAALNHAGVTASSITNYKCELDTEKGVQVYEIEFKAGGYEYEYKINATTGAVVSSEKEWDDDQNTTTTATTTTTNLIGESAAKTAALNHAGVTASSITQYKCELDTEKGVQVYEIEFKAGGYEYEYKINATTGAVVS
ncbi:MAG: PepSY domain-containing protein, partial [Firmicutes bacterium]|nr:PepSY domain-containing protein [Bacillota bacterium]